MKTKVVLILALTLTVAQVGHAKVLQYAGPKAAGVCVPGVFCVGAKAGQVGGFGSLGWFTANKQTGTLTTYNALNGVTRTRTRR